MGDPELMTAFSNPKMMAAHMFHLEGAIADRGEQQPTHRTVQTRRAVNQLMPDIDGHDAARGTTGQRQPPPRKRIEPATDCRAAQQHPHPCGQTR